jgi:hypothetical protein
LLDRILPSLRLDKSTSAHLQTKVQTAERSVVKDEAWNGIKSVLLGCAIGGVISITVSVAMLRKRIERLEDRSARMTEHINNHFEIGHGLKWAEIHSSLTAQESSNLWFAYQFARTNNPDVNNPGVRLVAPGGVISTLTISNASEKTITVTFPHPLKAKEDKP